MLKTYSSNSSFSDAKSQKDTAALMDEVNVCRVQFPRFSDERVIFRILVSGPLGLVCLSFLSHDIEQSSGRAYRVSFISHLRDLEKSNYLEMFALVS